ISLLHESNIQLPSKTYYVDNYFVYYPMGFVKTLYYLDIDFYRYFVGRVDQSITAANMSKRYDQQLRVMSLITKSFTYQQLKMMGKKHMKFMIHMFIVFSYLTVNFIYNNYTKEKGIAYKNYLKEFKKFDKKFYNRIRHRSYFVIPFLLIRPLRSWAVKTGDKLVRRKRRWNA
ncbi:MAG: hypothetical protein HUJ61_03730, partial [Bacilli bacterium]|nr:hypothetical protein [Bacilli bacterium]